MDIGLERRLINGQLFRITLHIDFLYTTGFLWAPVVRTLLTASIEGVGARGTAHQASANASVTGPALRLRYRAVLCTTALVHVECCQRHTEL